MNSRLKVVIIVLAVVGVAEIAVVVYLADHYYNCFHPRAYIEALLHNYKRVTSLTAQENQTLESYSENCIGLAGVYSGKNIIK